MATFFGDPNQWCGGGGGAYCTASAAASDIMWMGTATASTTSTVYTGVNCWTGGTGGRGTYTTSEYFEYQQMQALQMEHQQSLMQMQMQAQQIYATQGRVTQHQMSDEERRFRQAQAEALQQAQLEQSKLQTEAGAKAKELLLEHLTPAQKETFNKNKWFVVEGGKSKQQYRIRTDHCSINIEVMEGKKVKHKLCAHLHHSADAPLHDHILAQKIMLEAAEEDFLKIANRHAA